MQSANSMFSVPLYGKRRKFVGILGSEISFKYVHGQLKQLAISLSAIKII